MVSTSAPTSSSALSSKHLRDQEHNHPLLQGNLKTSLVCLKNGGAGVKVVGEPQEATGINYIKRQSLRMKKQ